MIFSDKKKFLNIISYCGGAVLDLKLDAINGQKIIVKQESTKSSTLIYFTIDFKKQWWY
jgi:hypothetical protein